MKKCIIIIALIINMVALICICPGYFDLSTIYEKNWYNTVLLLSVIYVIMFQALIIFKYCINVENKNVYRLVTSVLLLVSFGTLLLKDSFFRQTIQEILWGLLLYIDAKIVLNKPSIFGHYLSDI